MLKTHIFKSPKHYTWILTLVFLHLNINAEQDYRNTNQLESIINAGNNISVAAIPYQSPLFFSNTSLPNFGVIYEEKIHYPFLPSLAYREFSFKEASALTDSAQVTTDNSGFNGIYTHFSSNNLQIDSSFSYDKGIQDFSELSQFNISLQHQHQHNNVSFSHYVLSNLSTGNSAYYVPLEALNESKKTPTKTLNFLYVSEITYQPEKNKKLILRPYIRTNYHKDQLTFLRNTPEKMTNSFSAGLHSAYVREINKNISAQTQFMLDFVTGQFKEKQQYDYLPQIPAGLYYHYDVNIINFDWVVLLQHQITQNTSFFYDATINKIHYFFDNRLNNQNACHLNATCFYQSTDQAELNFLTFSATAGLKTNIFKHQFEISISNRHENKNGLDFISLQKDNMVKSIKPDEVSALYLKINKQFNPIFDYQFESFFRYLQHFRTTDENLMTYFNEDVKSLGFQLKGNLTTPSKKWQLAVSFEHQHTSYEKGRLTQSMDIKGNQVKLIPEYILLSSLKWAPTAYFETYLTYRQLGKYYLDARNQYSYSGHEICYFGINQKFKSHWSVDLSVNNLFDKQYAENAELISALAINYTLQEQRIIGAERSVILKVNKQF